MANIIRQKQNIFYKSKRSCDMDGENTWTLLFFIIKLTEKKNNAFDRAMPQFHMQFLSLMECYKQAFTI